MSTGPVRCDAWSSPSLTAVSAELGIPTVTDRLIQQALLQVLQPLLDPTFSEHSYGFRPGRCAQDAVLAAQRYVSSGRKVVVDVDLEKFFDRVDHDILIDRLRKRIADRAAIRLVRAYLDAGTLINGVIEKSRCGAPQGGPLSPLLANVLLDEVDRELEYRGHCFVRYADDANVYVRSHKAGQRVMILLRRLYEKLHLSVNESKSAVASAFGRKFLGYAFWCARDEVKRAVSQKAQKQFKQRIRQFTRRSCGRSLQQVVDLLRPYLLGWKAYFKLSQTPGVWRELDKWMRHRFRAIQLKQWKRGTTTYRCRDTVYEDRPLCRFARHLLVFCAVRLNYIHVFDRMNGDDSKFAKFRNSRNSSGIASADRVSPRSNTQRDIKKNYLLFKSFDGYCVLAFVVFKTNSIKTRHGVRVGVFKNQRLTGSYVPR